MSKYDELEKLHGLKEKGILTTEEFEAEKQKILSHEQDNVPTIDASPIQSPSLNQDILLYLHLSCIAGVILPFVGLVIPFILWQTNKQHPKVDQHGKMLLNWCGSTLIYVLAAFMIGIIQHELGLLLLAICTLVYIGFCIYGGIQATNNILYRYPLAIPFVQVDNPKDNGDSVPRKEKIQI